MTKLVRQPVEPIDSLDHKLTGEVDAMSEKDALIVFREEFSIAQMATKQLSYAATKEELQSYNVSLPESPGLVDLSEINRKYALAQSYATRVSNIEMRTIEVCALWSKLRKRLEEFIAEKSSCLLVQEKIRQLPNTTMQQAEVRNSLSGPYKFLSKVLDGEAEADAFRKAVDSKKKDLVAVVTNLTRQVKVLALENSLNR